jgi:hypothetical protein
MKIPMGKYFDWSMGTNIRTANKDMNIRFKCVGAEYNHPLHFREFNDTVAAFNPKVREFLNSNSPENTSGLVVLPESLKRMLNHRAYPIVDIAKSELVWLVDAEMLKKIPDPKIK